jgi:outer membrane protein assembly factor BamB
MGILALLVAFQDGALSEAEALRIGWPQLAGPYSTFEAAPVATPLVADLSQARLLWESDFRDLGRGKGSSQAYRRVEQFTKEEFARMGAPPGSWAGPIVADATVFCASWRPCGEEVEVQGVRARLDAEDLVVAIDALTGKTKWIAVEPGGILKGGGKRQGFQVGPVHHRGVVYSLGSTARLFAHDSATGRKIWESDEHPARAAEKKVREEALRGLAEGRWTYALSPNWCSSLAVAQDVLIVPDQKGGLLGVELGTGKRMWSLAGAIARWATPSVWRHDRREYVLCANEKGEIRLIDPVEGRELWKLGGLGPNWFTLSPGRSHVLVNVVVDSGDPGKGAERKPGHLGAVRLAPTSGERAWLAGEDAEQSMPVWMDSGARIRVLYRDGRFLVPNCWQGKGPKSEGRTSEEGGTALLLEESSGKVLSRLPAAEAWNDQLSGLAYWSGDRILARADSFHGPKHGGRHPWSQWSVANDELVRLPGRMDLAEFTNGYEVAMEAPLVAGLVFERTERGSVVCYDLRAK